MGAKNIQKQGEMGAWAVSEIYIEREELSFFKINRFNNRESTGFEVETF